MSRSTASLFFACALAVQAQAPVTPAPAPLPGPVGTLSLEVASPPSGQGLDPALVREDLRALCLRNGIPVLPASLVEGTPDAFGLEVSALVLQLEEGTCLLSVSERLAPLPGSGTRGRSQEWGANYMAAQAGDAGLLYFTRQVVLGLASHLIRQSRGAGAPTLAAPALAPPAPGDLANQPGPDLPQPLDLESGQVTVRIHPPEPPYPEAALEQQIEGTVSVQLTVDPEGRPTRAIAVGGPMALKGTALRYAMQWCFEPTLVEGQPRWVRFRLNLPFSLREPPPRAQ